MFSFNDDDYDDDEEEDDDDDVDDGKWVECRGWSSCLTQLDEARRARLKQFYAKLNLDAKLNLMPKLI